MHSRIPSILVLMLCFFAVALVAQAPADKPERYKIFDTIGDLEQHIAQYNDKTVVVNFWATYCGPCMEEVPFFDTLQKKYANTNTKIILVNLDFKNQLKQRLDPYLDKHPLNVEVVVLSDTNGDDWIPRVDEEWDGGLPFTMVLKQGQKKDTHRAEFASFADLDKFVSTFITPKPTLASKRR